MKHAMKRRRFLKLAGALPLTATLWPVLAHAQAAPPAPRVRIGALADLDAPGKYLAFVYPNQGSDQGAVAVRLAKPADGHTLSLTQGGQTYWLRAYSRRCPHAGCSVDLPDSGRIAPDTILVCPCHGSEYDGVNGALEYGPATIGLTALSLEVAAGDLYCTGIAPAL